MPARDRSSRDDSDRTQDRDAGRPRGRGRLPPLDARCEALVKKLRAACPGVLPEEPLPPGEPARPIPIEPEESAQLVRLAARQAAAVAALGRLPASDEALPGVTVWEDGTSALAVSLLELSVELDDGAIAVTFPVWCDQLPDRQDRVRVTFAIGSPGRPAGLLAATPAQPEGPRVIVDGWDEQLIALAWQAILDAAAGVAAEAGTDADGTPLVATALVAAKNGWGVLPQARHGFDRILSGRAVTR